MAVQSIRTSVQIRNVTGDHFLVPPRKVPFREMDGVGKLNYLAQKVRPRTKAFNNSWHLIASGPGAPEIVRRRDIALRFRIFDNGDLR